MAGGRGPAGGSGACLGSMPLGRLSRRWEASGLPPEASPGALKQVEEPVLVVLEHPEPVEELLELERLLAVPAGLVEQPLDPVRVVRAHPALRLRGRYLRLLLVLALRLLLAA